MLEGLNKFQTMNPNLSGEYRLLATGVSDSSISIVAVQFPASVSGCPEEGPEIRLHGVAIEGLCGFQFQLNAMLPRKPADVDDGTGAGTLDGGVDMNDLDYFLAQHEAGGDAADLDDGSGTGTPDGGVDINDLLFFLVHYEAGC